jgi:hypothetical protein
MKVMNDPELMAKYKLTPKLLESLGLWHNGKIEREKVYMVRLIDEQNFLSEVPSERQHRVKNGKLKDKLIHRYPYWYYSSFWGKEMTREPDTFGSGKYKGNFIPQIPIMAVKRFTKEGDLVIDNMAGSGTTVDVCNFLNRKCFAFDLYPQRDDVLPIGEIQRLEEKAKLFVMHPPYADLAICYGEKPYLLEEESERKYTNGKGLSVPPDEFLKRFRVMIQEEVKPHLADNGYVCLIIGDGWSGKTIYPLMAETLKLFELEGFGIKHIITKYIGHWTQRCNRAIWEYRALKGDFGVLEHEYVIILQKGDS